MLHAPLLAQPYIRCLTCLAARLVPTVYFLYRLRATLRVRHCLAQST